MQPAVFWGGGAQGWGVDRPCSPEGTGSAFFFSSGKREGGPDPGDTQSHLLGQSWVPRSQTLVLSKGLSDPLPVGTCTGSARLWEPDHGEGVPFLEHLLGPGSPESSVKGRQPPHFSGRHER